MTYLLFCFGAILFTVAVTPVFIARAPEWGLVDRPDPRKTHKKPMPVTGGPVLFPLVVVGYLAACDGVQGLAFLLAAASTIFVLGVVDDIKGVHFTTKFFVQVTAALLVMQSGALFDLNGVHLLQGMGVQFGLLGSTLVTLLWIVGVTNAVNLIDGMDGLASGLCLNAFVGIGVIAMLTAKPDLALSCLIMAGGLLGFLRYNMVPARTFLGDSGSMLLGFTLAVASILQSAKTSTFLVLVIPAMLLALPMADTALAFFRRTLSGRSPFKADRRHLHHKMLELNFSVKQTLGIFYTLSAALGILALRLVQTSNAQIVALALVVLIAALAAVKMMQVFNFHDPIRRANRKMRVLARRAVRRSGSDSVRLLRNLRLLLVVSGVNFLLLVEAGAYRGSLLAAVAGLAILGVLDYSLNRTEDEPRYELLHTVVFLSFVLSQVIILTQWPRSAIVSPVLALGSFLVLAALVAFLVRSGTLATFLQDPLEILDLFIALVAVGLAKHFMDAPSFLPFLVAVSNALVLYTLSKVYLTGHLIRFRFVTAGLMVFLLALMGMGWMGIS